MRVEQLQHYRFAVVKTQTPQTDNGQIVHDDNGQPKLEDSTEVQFLAPDGQHAVTIALSEKGRAELVRQLTGGLQVASAIEVPRVH